VRWETEEAFRHAKRALELLDQELARVRVSEDRRTSRARIKEALGKLESARYTHDEYGI